MIFFPFSFSLFLARTYSYILILIFSILYELMYLHVMMDDFQYYLMQQYFNKS